MMIKNNTKAAETNIKPGYSKKQPKGKPAIEIGLIITEQKMD